MSSHNCSIQGCERQKFSRGWCSTHYQQWYKAQARPCSIEGCERKTLSRGWCAVHYSRWRLYGHPLGASEPRPCRQPTTDEIAERRAHRNAHERERRKVDSEYRERRQKRNREYQCQRRQDPEYCQQQCEKARKRRQANSEYYRELDRLKNKSRRQDPEYREQEIVKSRERSRVRRQDPEYRERERQRKAESDNWSDLEWRMRNRDYIARQQRRQGELRKLIPSPRKRERWTPAEDAIVARDDITLTEMAYMLGRSYAAIALRRGKINSGQIRINP